MYYYYFPRDRRGRDRMIVGFTTTHAISVYHHYVVSSNLDKGEVYDKFCLWRATGWWFSPVSSTNKTDHYDITEILSKVALNTIQQTNKHFPNLPPTFDKIGLTNNISFSVGIIITPISVISSTQTISLVPVTTRNIYVDI